VFVWAPVVKAANEAVAISASVRRIRFMVLFIEVLYRSILVLFAASNGGFAFLLGADPDGFLDS
jgi:hypothetical protein